MLQRCTGDQLKPGLLAWVLLVLQSSVLLLVADERVSEKCKAIW